MRKPKREGAAELPGLPPPARGLGQRDGQRINRLGFVGDFRRRRPELGVEVDIRGQRADRLHSRAHIGAWMVNSIDLRRQFIDASRLERPHLQQASKAQSWPNSRGPGSVGRLWPPSGVAAGAHHQMTKVITCDDDLLEPLWQYSR